MTWCPSRSPPPPEGTHVVKALNTIFGHVRAQDKPLDAFLAGDSAEAKARVAAFLESLDMRARDAGGLEMAYVLEWGGILLMGLARKGAGLDIGSPSGHGGQPGWAATRCGTIGEARSMGRRSFLLSAAVEYSYDRPSPPPGRNGNALETTC